MTIPKEIQIPETPRFLLTTDHVNMQLYITCTSPLALIWVRQTTPGQLYIIEGPQDEALLRAAADFYRKYIASQNGN